MKCIFRILIVSLLSLIFVSAMAVAENDQKNEYHGALIREIESESHGALILDSSEEANDPFYLTPALRDDSTAELGDNSVAPCILIGGIGLASAGLIAAQKKLKRVS